MNHHNHRKSRIENPESSIENPTLAHFRHFSSLFTLSHLYICREPSTNQLLFMQNKPNFRKAKMNVIIYHIKDYQIIIPLAGQKNKPNSNPNKPNLKRAKMNANIFIIKDYRKKDDFLVRINKPNLVRRRRIPKGQNELKIACQKIRPHPFRRWRRHRWWAIAITGQVG